MALEWSLRTSCVLGISIVLHRKNGFLACQWGLALHHSDCRAPDTLTFQIVRDRNSTVWRAHQAQGLLCAGTGRSFFFHLANIPHPPDSVRSIIERMSPHQDDWDTHGLVWTSETWVLRAIETIASLGGMGPLTCPLVDVHERVILCATSMPISRTMQVVHNWLPSRSQNTFSAKRHKTQSR